MGKEATTSAGVVVATIIDWLQLRQLLVNGGRIGDLCKVECSDEHRTQLLQLPDESSAGHRAWGVEYTFSLGDAVQDCAEFVVHRPSLIARAAAKGLKCTLEARFDCFLDGERRRQRLQKRSIFRKYPRGSNPVSGAYI